jgi:hypothetical protein
MKTPSTLTLSGIIFLAFLGLVYWDPAAYSYPPPVPVIGPDGSAMHGPDGKPLMHHDISGLYVPMLLSFISFLTLLVCVVWLLVRFLRFVYIRWKCGGETT